MPTDHNNDVADIILSGSTTFGQTPFLVYDPISMTALASVGYDFQTVPVPASLVLMGSAIGLLGLRKRLS